MTFGTSIHCMDGRIQEPIIKYLKDKYRITYVDTITEPGPCKIIAENNNDLLMNSINNRISISIEKHKSRLIAISGHFDCAGNPCEEKTQKQQIIQSTKRLKTDYPELEIIGLWIDANWNVNPI